MPMVATPLCFWKMEKLQATAFGAVSAMFWFLFSTLIFSISYRLVSLTLELVALSLVVTSCENNTNACCDGLVCTELTQNFSQCLPAEDDSPVEPNTTKTATFPPSLRPVTRVKEKSKVSKRNLWFYRIGSFLMLCSLAAVIVAVVLDLKERRIEPNTNNLEMLDGTCKTLEEP